MNEVQTPQEQPCEEQRPVVSPLWTVEYTYNSYNGVALVRADTADEARQLFINQSNFNGDPSHLNVQVIRAINPDTLKGVVFEYYVGLNIQSQ